MRTFAPYMGQKYELCGAKIRTLKMIKKFTLHVKFTLHIKI